ncbi:MAG: hypothetical protein IT442_07965 [Phycisphaeraceae bacterium]|nr:hypothetical protein [Phycisphaeraceae bacterium]
MPSDHPDPLRHVFAAHPRTWADFRYVYPVISRRAEGLSIGINLNPDKSCNFDCIYCCVDRTIPPGNTPEKPAKFDLPVLRDELDAMLALVTSGDLWKEPLFRDVTPKYRRLNDIAFSGDGEPTACPVFAQAVTLATDIRAARKLDAAKLIVITNATLFDRPAVQKGLALFDPDHDEIWAKLDAGTQSYYQLIDRTTIPLTKVLANITSLARQRPLVIQSLWMNVHGAPPPEAEFNAYLDRLAEILAAGGMLKLVQLYTVARRVAEPYVSPLSNDQLDALADRFRARLPNLPVKVYHGVE